MPYTVIDLTPEDLYTNVFGVSYGDKNDGKRKDIFIVQQYVDFLDEVEHLVSQSNDGKMKGIFLDGQRGSGKSTIVFNLLRDEDWLNKHSFLPLPEPIDLPSTSMSILVWFLNFLLFLSGDIDGGVDVCEKSDISDLMGLAKQIEVIVNSDNVDYWTQINVEIFQIRSKIASVAKRVLEKKKKKYFLIVVDDLDMAQSQFIARFFRDVYFFLGDVPLVVIGVGDLYHLLKILCLYEVNELKVNGSCWEGDEEKYIIDERIRARFEKVFGSVYNIVPISKVGFFVRYPVSNKISSQTASKPYKDVSLSTYINNFVANGYLFSSLVAWFLLQNVSLRQLVMILTEIEIARREGKKIMFHELFKIFVRKLYVDLI